MKTNTTDGTTSGMKYNTTNAVITQMLPTSSLIAVQKLRYICSQTNFLSIPLEQFQRCLDELIVRIITPLMTTVPNSSRPIVSYQGICIERLLVHPAGVDWKKMCEHYNASYRSSLGLSSLSSSHCNCNKPNNTRPSASSFNSHNKYDLHDSYRSNTCTLLEVLLKSLTKASDINARHARIVSVITPSLIHALIRVVLLVRSGSNGNDIHNDSNAVYSSAPLPTPAQVLILNFVFSMLKKYPLVCISNVLETILDNEFDPCENTIAVTTWLCKQQPSIGPDVCRRIVMMLANGGERKMESTRIEWNDCDDIGIGLEHQVTNQACLAGTGCKLVIKRKCAMQMHDMNCLGETETMMIMSKPGENEQETVYRKRRRLQSNPHNDTTIKQKKARVQTLLEWLVSTFHTVLLSSEREFQYASSFHEVITVSCSHPRNINVKLAVLALCKPKGKILGCEILLQRVFEEYLACKRVQDGAGCESALRLYTEFVTDSYAFDFNTQLCCYAIYLLLDSAVYLKNDESVIKNLKWLHMTWLVRAIACIYSHRCQELLEDKMMVPRLALLFDSEDVFLENMCIPHIERKIYLRCFQYTGVISPYHEDIKSDVAICSGYERWPFNSQSRLLYANTSVFFTRPLITSNKFSDDFLLSKYSQRIYEDDDVIEESPPLLDYIHDEHILRLIVSHLGYRMLSKLAQVSKIFKRISSEQVLWRNRFKHRWKNCVEGLSLYSSNLCWKRLFIYRWVAEKGLRGKRSSRGFRYCLCSRVGCTQILRSETQLSKHVMKHENQDIKFVERDLKLLGCL